MNRYYFTACCSSQRITGISDIEKIIVKYGYIIDFKMFSDLSIGFMIETDEQRLVPFFEELKSYMNMNNFEPEYTRLLGDCIVLLNVFFTKGTGDMTIEVPSVPG